MLHSYLISIAVLWVDWADIIPILQFRKLKLGEPFSMAIESTSVSFENPVLYTLRPSASREQGAGPGGTVVPTLAASQKHLSFTKKRKGKLPDCSGSTHRTSHLIDLSGLWALILFASCWADSNEKLGVRTNSLENGFCSEIMSEELEKVQWAHIAEVLGNQTKMFGLLFSRLDCLTEM